MNSKQTEIEQLKQKLNEELTVHRQKAAQILQTKDQQIALLSQKCKVTKLNNIVIHDRCA